MANFEEQKYCKIDGITDEAIAGKDLVLCIYNIEGDKLLAVSGQNELEINMKRDIITLNSKTIKGGWKTNVSGSKEWDMTVDGVYNYTQETHKTLLKIFNGDGKVCIKVVDQNKLKPVTGGLALLEEYKRTAGAEDSATFSCTLKGLGALVDLSEMEAPEMPENIKEKKTKGK